MKAFILACALAATCKPSPAPPPAPPPGPLPPVPVVSPAVEVYNKLVAANCMAPDDAGVEAVAEEYASFASTEPWIACMWVGGSVSACQAPCDSASLRGKLKLRR
jgi:hypothetical protein